MAVAVLIALVVTICIVVVVLSFFLLLTVAPLVIRWAFSVQEGRVVAVGELNWSVLGCNSNRECEIASVKEVV